MRKTTRPFRLNGWALGSALIAAMIALPNLDIVRHLFLPANDNWAHIAKYLLKDAALNSAVMLCGTILLSASIASLLAWFVTVYDFPGKSFLSLGLLLPIAIPPYIGAYTYAGMLGYTGSIQRFLREVLHLSVKQSWFDIMNMRGAIFIFTVFLYPYTYIVLRTFLHQQSAGIIESGKLLGHSMGSIYSRIILPLTRNALIAGSTLVAFETLSDYGVVSYFGLPVLSTSIFKSWLSFNDIDSALRLSAIFLAGIAAAVTLEKRTRKNIPRSYFSAQVRHITPMKITGWKKTCVMLFVYLVFALGFMIPVLQIILWSIYSLKNVRFLELHRILWNTVSLAAFTAVLITFSALLIANFHRLFKSRISAVFTRIALLGYSIPSSIVAITVLLFFLDIDALFSTRLNQTLAMLILAYLIRYSAVAYQNMETGFEKIGRRFHESSRVLGKNRLKTLIQVDLPMMKAGLIGALSLVFVDIVKELPILLILRPFNFNTLSTKVFEYAHDEMIPESSVASLMIIVISTLPVIFLYRFNYSKYRRKEQ